MRVYIHCDDHRALIKTHVDDENCNHNFTREVKKKKKGNCRALTASAMFQEREYEEERGYRVIECCVRELRHEAIFCFCFLPPFFGISFFSLLAYSEKKNALL